MIAGVVLAGGQSSRYGEPKMFAHFQGAPLYEQSLRALKQAGIERCVIATNALLRPKFNNSEAEFVIEQMPHEGPLVALQQVMHAYPQVDAFFVLACDLPYVDATFVQQLLAALSESDDVVLPVQNERIQPLAAIYHRRILPAIDAAVRANKRSMRAIIQDINVRFVPFDAAARYFININRQDDWPKEANMPQFTHWNEHGRPKMVDITHKVETKRSATARATVAFSEQLYAATQAGTIKKGDPTQVAQIAGIMAAKKTSELIPMCHPIILQGTDFNFTYHNRDDKYELVIEATVKCSGQTGVEMEALTAVSIAALTFYDMCKAVDPSMIIRETCLVEKTGGKSDFSRD